MIVDLLVLIVLIISALIAFMRGFIRETLTILGMLGGVLASFNFGGSFVPKVSAMLGVVEGEKPEKLMGILPMDLVAQGLAYGLVFLVVVIVLSVLSHFLAEAVKSMGMGAIDRTLGVIFGLLRGVVLLGIAYLPFYLLMNVEDKEKWFGSARSYFYLDKTSAAMARFIPSDATQEVSEGLKDIEGVISTRERLQQIDLLKKDVPDDMIGTPRRSDEKGYDDNFRDTMDELFERKAGELNE